MAAKQKPCTLGPKHKWEFVKNITLKSLSVFPGGSTATIKFRGLYKCACGGQRVGRNQDDVKVDAP